MIHTRHASGRLIGASLVIIIVLCTALASGRARAESSQPQILVDRATVALQDLLRGPDQRELGPMLDTAAGVLIVPNMLKAGFFFGAEGGSGVLLARHQTGEWSAPAFYTVGSASFGLQFGAETSDMVFVIRNQGALQAVLSHKVKLGADVSAALGPIGVGREAAATTNVGADIVAFAKSAGLFAGGSVEGTVIADRNDWNRIYYGGDTEPVAIIQGRISNPGADRLRQALMR